MIQNTFHFNINFKIQIIMSETTHLCELWEHTIVKIFKHDHESELGIMIKEWVKFNKLENFYSLLNYSIDDFTPSGNLCYINGNHEILHSHHCMSFST